VVFYDSGILSPMGVMRNKEQVNTWATRPRGDPKTRKSMFNPFLENLEDGELEIPTRASGKRNHPAGNHTL
jgi:hypothetical protein